MTWTQLAGRNFRSSQFWIITLVALSLCLLTARLSLWQLQRATQKQQLADQLVQAAEQPVWQDADFALALQQPAQSASERAQIPDVLRLQPLELYGLVYAFIDLIYNAAHAIILYSEKRFYYGGNNYQEYTTAKPGRRNFPGILVTTIPFLIYFYCPD